MCPPTAVRQGRRASVKGRHADDPQARPRRGGPRLPPSWPRAPSSCRGGSGPRGGAPSSPSAAQAPTNCGSQRPHLPGPLVTRPLWWRQLSDPRFTPRPSRREALRQVNRQPQPAAPPSPGAFAPSGGRPSAVEAAASSPPRGHGSCRRAVSLADVDTTHQSRIFQRPFLGTGGGLYSRRVPPTLLPRGQL